MITGRLPLLTLQPVMRRTVGSTKKRKIEQ
jgi:hypothetical protein